MKKKFGKEKLWLIGTRITTLFPNNNLEIKKIKKNKKLQPIRPTLMRLVLFW
jgi:hypothetical protein